MAQRTHRIVGKEESTNTSQYIYEVPTVRKLAYMYWAINKMDIEDDEQIDRFMLITECSMYQTYRNQEFEWKKIRDAARQFIRDNKSSFPVRFEYVQSLGADYYDEDRQAFKIVNRDAILSTRSFEAMAKDASQPVCGNISVNGKNGYETGVIFQLNRPITLQYIPMTKEKAEKFMQNIANKIKNMSQSRRAAAESNLKQFYLVMDIKAFAYKQTVSGSQFNTAVAEIYSVLEGYEIYSDFDRKNLIYKMEFKKKNMNKKVLDEISDNFKSFVDSVKDVGMFTN